MNPFVKALLVTLAGVTLMMLLLNLTEASDPVRAWVGVAVVGACSLFGAEIYRRSKPQ